jgi:competence protein ComEC
VSPGLRTQLTVIGRIAAAAACLVALYSGVADAAPVSGDLKIFVLNVGQGDAILVVCPHGTHQLLIDTGAKKYPGSREAFQQQLQALMGTDSKIEVVVSTHPHEDHIGSLAWVLGTFRIGKIIDSGFSYTSEFHEIPTTIKQKNNAGQLLAFQAKAFPAAHLADFCPASNVKAELLIPQHYGESSSNKNNVSVVTLVTYNSQKFLFTGDAEKQEERLLLQDPVTATKLRDVSLYKVGHHGAETSSTPGLLNAIKPAIATVSSGCKNVSVNTGYRHPRAVIIDALDAAVPGAGADERTLAAGKPQKGQWTTSTIHRNVYATSADGAIVITTDGSTIRKVNEVVAGAPQACP